MSRSLLVRFALLAVVVLGGFAYLWFDVLDYGIGTSTFPVTVRLPRTGGLFDGSYVSYRGVDVGRVTNLRLTPTGVAATLSINNGTRIPANSNPTVRDLSAVGEQYLDLTPTGPTQPAGPGHDQTTATPAAILHRGSSLTASDANLPVPVNTVITNLDAFTTNIDTSNLSSLLNESTTALQGTGPSLHQLLLGTEELSTGLQTSQPAATQLIDRGHDLLQLAQATNGDVATFTTNLDLLSRQLAASNSDITSLIGNGVPSFDAITNLLRADTNSAIALTNSSATVLSVFAHDNPAVVALFQSLPSTADALASTIHQGAIHADDFWDNNGYDNLGVTPVCTYNATGSPAPSIGEPTAASIPLDLNRHCTNPASTGSPLFEQRGAQNAPRPQP